MIFDTHCHLNHEDLYSRLDEVLDSAKKVGVEKILVVGWDKVSSLKAIELAEQYDFIYAAIGIHPSDIAGTEEEILEQIKEIKKLASNKKVVAIGEIGLDYHWEKDKKELQKFAFLKQIELANELKLPIVIHTRDAIMDTIEIFKGQVIPQNSGILHCCTLNKDLIEQGLKIGLYVSFAGPITFKNTKNTELINIVPENRILIETDCPYLSPEPNRGKRNDSRNVKYVAQKLAEIRGKTVEEMANITYNNAINVFKL